MSKYTKILQFDKETQEKIYVRDEGRCIFCAAGYHQKSVDWLGYQIKDIMHFVNKSQGGLGIEQNGALGCRYHHSLLDNGAAGVREEMLGMFENHLKNKYTDWNVEKLKYKKYDF